MQQHLIFLNIILFIAMWSLVKYLGKKTNPEKMFTLRCNSTTEGLFLFFWDKVRELYSFFGQKGSVQSVSYYYRPLIISKIVIFWQERKSWNSWRSTEIFMIPCLFKSKMLLCLTNRICICQFLIPFSFRIHKGFEVDKEWKHFWKSSFSVVVCKNYILQKISS